VTSLDSSPSAPRPQALDQVGATIRAALGPLLAHRWQRPVLLLAGGLLVSESLVQALHLDAGLLPVAALAGGWWWLSQRNRPVTPRLPNNPAAWLERCQSLLAQFERLEGGAGQAAQQRRQAELQALRASTAPRPLDLALVGCQLPPKEHQQAVAVGLRHRGSLRLHWGEPLPTATERWSWPAAVRDCDVVVYHLPLPLLAVDLRWLEALPAGQPLWLLCRGAEAEAAAAALAPLHGQGPEPISSRLLLWDGEAASLDNSLEPLTRWLNQESGTLRQATPLRRLEEVHRCWQAELETLRRREWRALLQRSQWLVAAGVAATPLASLDLVVMAAANALMLQEMARIWDCPWSAEQLRAVAAELGQACLGLGLVEWSSQALLAVLRLEGTGWLVGTALQALAAAFLTRVVSHAMADYMALCSGVAAPDLEAVKRQAPVLVSQAAAAERLDWNGFLQQASGWLRANPARPAGA
jgi:uncharacterized protein (DUF697 family)